MSRQWNFKDRKPTDKPILCTDGKLRLSKYTTINMIEDKPQPPIKAYGGFIASL